MSLDVCLMQHGEMAIGTGIFVRKNGQIKEISRAEWNKKFPGREPIVAEVISDGCCYSDNITHNLGKMANKAGIYNHLWHPNELGITTAKELIEPLRSGLVRLSMNPIYYSQFNPKNGWGNYSGLVRFVRDYLAACEKFPYAKVSVSR